MNKLGIALTLTDLVVSLGAGQVVGHAIKATTPANLSFAQKAVVQVGGFVLANAVGSFASDYARTEALQTVEQFYKLKAAALQAKN